MIFLKNRFLFPAVAYIIGMISVPSYNYQEVFPLKRLILQAAGLLCAGALALSLAGCGSSSESSSSSAEAGVSASFGAASKYDYENFSYSQGIDSNGYWEGVRALDYVTLPEDFRAVPVSRANVEPSEEDIQDRVDYVLASAAVTEQVMDRAAANGDTVNIDFAGSVDGVSFNGGTSAGFDLELGSSSFIDGFEEQIVGHTPGESFDVVVTFPEGYRDSTDEAGNTVVLSGKEAVFAVTLNYISVTTLPELTDEWVADYLGESDGIHTVDELNAYFQDYLYQQNLSSAVFSYLMANANFSGCPDIVLNYQVCECLDYYASSAEHYGVGLEEFVQDYIGYDDLDALLAAYEADIYTYCQEALLYQAVAESLELVATDELYASYSSYADTYGENYLRMYALVDAVMETLCEGAVVA